MFKLSRRKGSSHWQVRKRWPMDVASSLTGEFTRSTGEGDKKRAQDMLPTIAAEYQRLVQQARDRLADNTQRDLTRAEMARLAARFYGEVCAHYAGNKFNSRTDTLKALKENLAYRGTALLDQNYGTVRRSVDAMIEREGLPVPEDSPSRVELERLSMMAWIEAMRRYIAELEGEPAPPFRHREIGDLVSADAKPKKTVEDLLDAYEAAKVDGWSVSTKAAFSPVRRLLLDSIGTREVTSLTREDARKVQSLVKRLPVNLGQRKALSGLTVPQAIEKATKLGLPIISAKTMNAGYLVHIAAVFNWALVEDWTVGNMFLKLAVADRVDDADRRDPFTSTQLSRLFGGEPWDAPATRDMVRPGRFWVPLLGLYQGARRGELAGLRVRDVEDVDGIITLNIRPNAFRALKNAASRRVVPVHPSVLALGFADFVSHRREQKTPDALLFPDMAAKERGQVGYNLGVWFGSRVKTLKLEGTNLALHSLRHNFEDALRSAGLHGTSMGLALAGREDGGSQADYGKGNTMADSLAALSKVSYPGLNLNHLKVGRS